MKDLLLTTLHFVASFIPDSFRPFTMTLLDAFQHSGWLEEDKRWADAAAVVTRWMNDVQAAQTVPDKGLQQAARLAAELNATRELSRLNLLKAV